MVVSIFCNCIRYVLERKLVLIFLPFFDIDNLRLVIKLKRKCLNTETYRYTCVNSKKYSGSVHYEKRYIIR